MATVATLNEELPQAVAGILPSPAWKVWLAIAAVSIAWGTTFLAIRVMVRTIPPLIGGGVRYLLACSVMFGIVLARRRLTGTRQVLIRHGWRVHASLFVMGVALAASFSAVGIAEQHITSSLAALIYASMPLWVIVLRVGVGREHVRGVTLAGTVVGFLGVGMVLLSTSSVHANGGSVAICLVASAGWAAATYAGTRLLLPRDVLLTAGYEVLWGAIVSIALGFALGEGAKVHLDSISTESIVSVVYLALVSTGIGFTCFAWLLRHAPVSRTATSSYITPLVAVFAAWLILGENIGAQTLVGAAIIVASIGLTVTTDRGATLLEEPATP
jgi:drug/metabolite transporter (DMT)-like permease